MYFWYTFHETVVYYVANWKMKIVSNDIGNLYSIKKKKIGDGWDCFPQKMIDPPLHPSDNKTVRFFFLLTQYIFFSNEPLFFCRFENNSDSRNIADKMKAFFWKGHPTSIPPPCGLMLDASSCKNCSVPEVFWCTFNLSWTWTLLWDNRCFQNAIPSFCTNFTKISWC